MNDRPVLNAALAGRPTPVAVGAVDPAGDTVAALLGGAVTDVDAGALRGVAVVGTSGLGGRWRYRRENGTWEDVGTVSATQALLLTANDGLVFLPDPTFQGTVSLIYRAWDRTQGAAGTKVPIPALNTAVSAAVAAVSLAINGVNDRPVLDVRGTPGIGPMLPNTTEPAGTAVSALLGWAFDPDPGAERGIAVTAAAAVGGTWQYSINGGATWDDVVGASGRAALLLRDVDLVRFVPAAGFRGRVGLSYRAWDRTAGAVGGRADATRRGATAFSLAAETVVLVINTDPRLRV